MANRQPGDHQAIRQLSETGNTLGPQKQDH